MGPFGLPWQTFSALLVVAASVLVSALWALASHDGDGGDR